MLRVRGEKEKGFRRHFVVKCLPGNYHVYDERHKVAADDDYAAERASVTCLQYNLKQMTRFPRPRFPPHTLFTDTRFYHETGFRERVFWHSVSVKSRVRITEPRQGASTRLEERLLSSPQSIDPTHMVLKIQFRAGELKGDSFILTYYYSLIIITYGLVIKRLQVMLEVLSRIVFISSFDGCWASLLAKGHSTTYFCQCVRSAS